MKNIEKDDEGNLSKNSKTLRKFVLYALQHPEMRFWQALRNWAKADYIIYQKGDSQRDTFYWSGKDEF